MHLLSLHLDTKGHCSCSCCSLNSHQEPLVQFLPTKPLHLVIYCPFPRNNLNFFSFDVQFCIGLSSSTSLSRLPCLPSEPDCPI